MLPCTMVVSLKFTSLNVKHPRVCSWFSNLKKGASVIRAAFVQKLSAIVAILFDPDLINEVSGLVLVL